MSNVSISTSLNPWKWRANLASVLFDLRSKIKRKTSGCEDSARFNKLLQGFDAFDLDLTITRHCSFAIGVIGDKAGVIHVVVAVFFFMCAKRHFYGAGGIF